MAFNMGKELEARAKQNRFTGFLPDKQLFEDDLNASLDSIKADLPYDMEAYNADLASRGIYSSGEAPKHMYRSVVAPVAREMAGAVTRSKLAYSQQYQQGMMAEAEMEANYMNMMMNWIIENKRIKAREDAQRSSFIGSLFSGAARIGAAYITAGGSEVARAAMR